jgi:glycosyltransferase involved in cell wall biosynthesis
VLVGPRFHNSPTELPPGVQWLGSVSHATVLAAWDRARFGVVPSVGAETFGNVATEALSRGRPVVASRLGGIVDIVVDDECGLLVPPADVPALAAAMQRLIDEPETCARLGRGATERARRFRADEVLPRFERLYLDVLAGRR